MKRLILASLLLGFANGVSLAQEIHIQKHVFGSPSGEMTLPTFNVVTTGGVADAKQVKGAPFAAEFSSESVQTLADGNRIVCRSTSSFYRDNDGRTRREQTLVALQGLMGNNQDVFRQIFIYDPITNSNYVINPLFRTAQRTKIFNVTVDANATSGKNQPSVKLFSSAKNGAALDATVEKRLRAGLEAVAKAHSNQLSTQQSEPREESLGTANVAGVEAEGKRVTTVLPANAIGNERPIEIVRETWYSKELQMVVMTTTKNPLTGDQTYKLTSLVRGEQPRSLFEVPSGYKIVDGTNLLNHFLPVSPDDADLQPLYPKPSNGESRLFLFKKDTEPMRQGK